MTVFSELDYKNMVTGKTEEKKDHIKKDSAFIKHLINKHKEVNIDKVKLKDVYDVRVIKSYREVFKRGVDEGTNIGAHEGDLLNSKSEWRQHSIIRNVIVSKGAEVLTGGQGRSCPRDEQLEERSVAGVVLEGGRGVASRTRSRRVIG